MNREEPFLNIGFGNMVRTDKIISMMSADAAPIKRMVQVARDEGRAVDGTCGRKTRTVIVMESGHLVLSALNPETLSARNKGQDKEKDETDGA